MPDAWRATPRQPWTAPTPASFFALSVETLSAVCMAGGAGTDNGPEVESRLVLGLSILRRSSSSSSRPTTSPCKVRLPCARHRPAPCEPSRCARVLARAPTVPRAGVAGASGEVAVGEALAAGAAPALAARAASHIHEPSTRCKLQARPPSRCALPASRRTSGWRASFVVARALQPRHVALTLRVALPCVVSGRWDVAVCRV